MATCPNCGHQVRAEANFCTNCGHDMNTSVPEGERMQTEQGDVAPPPPQSTQQPLLEARSAPLTSQPSQITILEDGLRVFTAHGIIKRSEQRLTYNQIAQVIVNNGFFFANLIIETRGGGTLTVTNLAKKDANMARDLIDARLRY